MSSLALYRPECKVSFYAAHIARNKMHVGIEPGALRFVRKTESGPILPSACQPLIFLSAFFKRRRFSLSTYA
jgi:hypothetical protein